MSNGSEDPTRSTVMKYFSDFKPLWNRAVTIGFLIRLSAFILIIWVAMSGLSLIMRSTFALRPASYGFNPAESAPAPATEMFMPQRAMAKKSSGFAVAAANAPSDSEVFDRSGGPNIAESLLGQPARKPVENTAQANRKIIYTADVELVSEDINALEPKLLEMISQAEGFIAETNQTGSSGNQRTATWRIRVPVGRYDGFLQKIRSLGEVQSVRVTSQDVTEEFVDVSARIASKKVQEERLIDLLKNAVGKLDEVLKVESELARVRSEIERMEGRIRFLRDQTDLTTVTLSVREFKDYLPPEKPTFATKIKRVWDDSTKKLSEDAGNLVLAIVAWIPFLPLLPFFLACLGLFFWFSVRIWRKIRPWLFSHIEIRKVSQEPQPPTTGSDQSIPPT